MCAAAAAAASSRLRPPAAAAAAAQEVFRPPLPIASESIECYYSGRIGDELRESIDWPWLAQAHRAAHAAQGDDATPSAAAGGVRLETCQLWAGSGRGATPLHFDALSNLLAQLSGRKRVVLFPPSSSFHVHPYPVGHPKDNFAAADLADPLAVERWPGLRHARGLEGVLAPGDALWLPRYYWHFVEQMDDGDENLSLNFWAGRKGTGDLQRELWRVAAAGLPPRAVVEAAAAAAAQDAQDAQDTAQVAAQDAADPAVVEVAAVARDDALLGASESLAETCLLASRHVEGSSLELLGAERAGAFLTALAAGSDGAPWGDAAVRHGERVRAELIALLGSARAGFARAGSATAGSATADGGSAGRGCSTSDGGREGAEDVVGGEGAPASSQLGIVRCNALLRAMTRHGRLKPGGGAAGGEGLSHTPSDEAEVQDERVVNSERGELTSDESYARMVRALERGT